MSPFKLKLTRHAEARLKLRKITRLQIRTSIMMGLAKGKRIATIRIGGRILKVVYIKISGGYYVITSFWKGSNR